MDALLRCSGQLLYQLALLSENLMDNAKASNLCISERLKLVEARHKGWRTLEWWRTDLHPLTGGCPMYEICGNAFTQLWDTYVLEEDFYTKLAGLNVLYLPSAARNVAEIIQVSHSSLGPGPVKELGMDPDQDLLLLINMVNLPRTEVQAYVLRLSLAHRIDNKCSS